MNSPSLDYHEWVRYRQAHMRQLRSWYATQHAMQQQTDDDDVSASDTRKRKQRPFLDYDEWMQQDPFAMLSDKQEQVVENERSCPHRNPPSTEENDAESIASSIMDEGDLALNTFSSSEGDYDEDEDIFLNTFTTDKLTMENDSAQGVVSQRGGTSPEAETSQKVVDQPKSNLTESTIEAEMPHVIKIRRRVTFETSRKAAIAVGQSFTVQAKCQVLGLWEGLVPIKSTMYTIKDYQRNILSQSRYDEAPTTTGRFLEVTPDFMAVGSWTAHWQDIEQSASFCCNREYSLILRHVVRGKGLPNRLPSSSSNEHAQDKVLIKTICPCATRSQDLERQGMSNELLASDEGSYLIGSLSLFAFEGFESHVEMTSNVRALAKQVLSAAWNPTGEDMTSDPRTYLWPVQSEFGPAVGATLLCAMSSQGSKSAYKIRLAVDQEDEAVTGVDVIFADSKSTFPSCLQESPALPNRLATDCLGQHNQRMGSNHFYLEDSNGSENGNQDISSYSSVQESFRDCDKSSDRSVSSELEGSPKYSPNFSKNGEEQGLFRDTLMNQVTVTEPNPRRLTADSIKLTHLDPHSAINNDPPDLEKSELRATRKIDDQQVEDASSDRSIPLVTPYLLGKDIEMTLDEGSGPRRLEAQFENVSGRLNKSHSEVEGMVEDEWAQNGKEYSACFNKAVDSGHMWTDEMGKLDSLSEKNWVESQETVDEDHFYVEEEAGSYDQMLAKSNETTNETFVRRFEILLHDGLFGSHDEAETIEMTERDCEITSFYDDCDDGQYETNFGFLWSEWIFPCLTMLALTAPTAFYLIAQLRETEMFDEPEELTWTEWLWNWV